MATQAKEQMVGELREMVGSASGIVLTDFTGLNVAAVSDLRRRCRAAGVEYRVIKNTLARRVIAETSMAPLGTYLAGANAWAVHKTDQVAAAKVLSDFAKENDKLKIRAGYIDGRVVTDRDIAVLAKLPGREVLLGQVVGAMAAPMSSFAGAMTALLRNFAGVVDAYAKKRAETGA